MSYGLGNTVFAPEGEQFNVYTDQRYNLGQRMVLPDGRVFRFVKSADSLVAGKVVQSAANVANHLACAVTTAAAAATALTVTLGATAATLDQYADGYAISDEQPGGWALKIVTHPAANSAATLALTLHPKTPLQAAYTNGSTTVSLIKNPYKDVVLQPTSPTGTTLGIACATIASGSWGWVQTRGIASVLTSGTLVLGNSAVLGGATGALTPSTASTEKQAGQVQRVAATTKYSVVYLTLE